MRKRQSEKGIRWLSGYDFSLLFVVLFLCVFGLIMIYSASYYTAETKLHNGMYYFRHQLMLYGIGLAVAVIASLIPHRYFIWLVWPGYAAAVICMILTDFTKLGINTNGQTRWMRVTSTISFQPAELVKVAIILMTAFLIHRHTKEMNGHRWPLIILGLCAAPGLLVLKNNLSSGIIILAIPIAMIMLVSDKKPRRIFFWVAVALGLALMITIKLMPLDTLIGIGERIEATGLLKAYQLRRLYIWNSPMYDARGDGYQVVQGLYAIGSGGVFGKGLGASMQKLGFVPESANDMIFAILCEELGLFGAVSLIVLYLFLLYRMMMIANRSRDVFGSMLVIGVMGHIALQVILHIGVVSGILPNTGVTLPFVSYGGTASLFYMGEIGMVLSVGRDNPEMVLPEETEERS